LRRVAWAWGTEVQPNFLSVSGELSAGVVCAIAVKRSAGVKIVIAASNFMSFIVADTVFRDC